MEWGLVMGRDPYLFGQRLKYFLLKGARRTRTDLDYPSPTWGYGTLCVRNAIEIWNEEVASRSGSANGISNSITEQEANLFINIPKDIYSNLVHKSNFDLNSNK
jgi:hypothetical protein